jgi:hypothetical protein
MKHKAIGIQDKPVDNIDDVAPPDEVPPEEPPKDEELPENQPPVEQPVVEPKKEEPPTVDYETKFKESQKEAMILKAQLDKVEEEKNKKVELTDEVLKGMYPEWDDMTPVEQKAMRRAEQLAQEVAEIKNNTNQFNNDKKWAEKVETFVTDEMPDLFPDIVGREEEFKRFATRPTRKGLPMDDLAKVFLFENPPKEPKKSLFHAPGGEGKAPEEQGMNDDEIRMLRITKPLEYMRLVRAKKIQVKV